MTAKRKKINSTQKKVRAGSADKGGGGYVDHGLQLVILDRGFVYVGDVRTNGEWCVIAEARNVRRWGTTEGLGELALKGPLAATQLDDTGMVRAPMRSLIALIACNRQAWK